MSQKESSSPVPASRGPSSLAFLAILLVLVAGGEALYIYLLNWEKGRIEKDALKTEQDLNRKITELHEAAQEQKSFRRLVGYDSEEDLLALTEEFQTRSLKAVVEELQRQVRQAQDDLQLKMEHAGLEAQRLQKDIETRDEQLQQARDDLKLAKEEAKQAEENLGQARKELEEARKAVGTERLELLDRIRQLTEDLGKKDQEFAKELAEKDQQLLKNQADLDAKDAEIAKLEDERQKEKDGWENEKVKINAYVDQLNQEIDRLNQKIDRLERQLALLGPFEIARKVGQITDVDLEARFVSIDLGEGEAEPGMRFEVFEQKDSGEKVLKGMIEVKNVHPSVSTATIVDSDRRNPIVKGDMVLEILERSSS